MKHQIRLNYLAKILKRADLEEALIQDRRTLTNWFKEHAPELADLVMEMIFDPDAKEEILERIEEAYKEITS